MNRAPGHRAALVARRFFNRFPNFRDVSEDHVNELAAMFRPLGLQNVRARRIIDMSFDDVRMGKAFTDCRGVGDYAADSIRLFVYEDYDYVPKDKELKARRLELLESKV
jgi:endonuclease III